MEFLLKNTHNGNPIDIHCNIRRIPPEHVVSLLEPEAGLRGLDRLLLRLLRLLQEAVHPRDPLRGLRERAQPSHGQEGDGGGGEEAGARDEDALLQVSQEQLQSWISKDDFSRGFDQRRRENWFIGLTLA